MTDLEKEKTIACVLYQSLEFDKLEQEDVSKFYHNIAKQLQDSLIIPKDELEQLAKSLIDRQNKEREDYSESFTAGYIVGIQEFLLKILKGE